MTNSPNGDDIIDNLVSLKGDKLEPRLNLSELEKKDLIKLVGGPKTTRSILRAKKDFSLARIPWLFSSLDSQAVIDILHNDMESSLQKLLQKS